ncbi:MAG: transposase [Planctomycetes bacterium]|nr:transposase [Planctomycetota bacterium]
MTPDRASFLTRRQATWASHERLQVVDTTPPRPRGDHPGAWHHVTNRGLARRSAFEGRSDVRTFLALLARRVREQQIEVHAFAILTTHFHLLLRSTRGELSDAMMWIENRYVKHFNRLRDRDGSLFGSRFRSRLIDTDEYWFNVVRYIDANPVDAKLCAHPAEYEFGSARMYCGSRSAPWLTRDAIETTVMRLTRTKAFERANYERLFCSGIEPDERWIIERRMQRGGPNCGGEELGNELLFAAPEHVLKWLQARAEMADGGAVGLTLASPAQIERHVRRVTGADSAWCGPSRAGGFPAWRTLEAGLLRQMAGLKLEEAAARMQVSCSGLWKMCHRHAERLSGDARYADGVRSVVRELQRERRPTGELGSGRLGLVAAASGVSNG